MIAQVLKELGLDAHLRIASDGESALKAWSSLGADPQSPCPGLVLLDLNLPKIPGLEVLAHIRKGSYCANVPVVIVTSSSSAADLEPLRSLNASAYFQKPADLSEYMSLGQVILDVLSGGKQGPPTSAGR